MSTDTSAPPLPENNATAADFHREIGDELFNQVLVLVDRADRNCEENARMIHAAHASRLHFEFGGTVVNIALGEWQCSRVHCAMGHSDAGLYHAFRYLEMAESYGLGPFHLSYAHAAVARAYTICNRSEAERHLEQARELSLHTAEGEERDVLNQEITAVTRLLSEPAAAPSLH